MSVERTPPTLVTISSTPSPLSAKLCPMFVKRSVQELEFYSLVSRLRPISYIIGIYWQGPSRLFVECTPSTLVSLTSFPSPMSAKLCPMSVHRSVQELEFYSLVSRLRPISYTISTFGRAVVGCPSNAHPQLWCLSAPVHHLCLESFVP